MLKNFLLFSLLFLMFNLEANENKERWLRPALIPSPQDNQLTPQRVHLGKLLFFDTRLSVDNTISCSTCHHPKRGWTDLVPVAKAIGFEGRKGPRNSSTILNTAYQNRQFWDGRVKTLEAQALGPIGADVEMNMNIKELIPKLNAIQGYVKLFKDAYPDENLTKETLAKAIASFERTVVSQDSPFDEFIKGDLNAISKDAKDGFELFKTKAHCIYCHDGFNFTDGSFHNIGLNDGELKGKELGRYNVKNRDAWYGAMKTPTLRDITKSYPYFHDGSVKNLEEATSLCAKGGRHKIDVKNRSTSMRDRHLTQKEIEKIVIFMKTLTSPDMTINIPTKFPQ